MLSITRRMGLAPSSPCPDSPACVHPLRTALSTPWHQDARRCWLAQCQLLPCKTRSCPAPMTSSSHPSSTCSHSDSCELARYWMHPDVGFAMNSPGPGPGPGPRKPGWVTSHPMRTREGWRQRSAPGEDKGNALLCFSWWGQSRELAAAASAPVYMSSLEPPVQYPQGDAPMHHLCWAAPMHGLLEPALCVRCLVLCTKALAVPVARS